MSLIAESRVDGWLRVQARTIRELADTGAPRLRPSRTLTEATMELRDLNAGLDRVLVEMPDRHREVVRLALEAAYLAGRRNTPETPRVLGSRGVSRYRHRPGTLCRADDARDAKVRELRRNGFGYKRVALALGISRDSARDLVRRIERQPEEAA